MADGKLRVLPLGGLGEIGKNMTVVEYDGSIVIVDTGLRFPTAEQVGIDLVLPDFTYLRERADAIEGIIITHGHEDHVGALPWMLRELGRDIPVFGGPPPRGPQPPTRPAGVAAPDGAGRRPGLGRPLVGGPGVVGRHPDPPLFP